MATQQPSTSACAGLQCQRCRSANAALGDTAWSDSRWHAMDPEQSTDTGGFSLPVLAGLGVVVAVIFFIVRAWL